MINAYLKTDIQYYQYAKLPAGWESNTNYEVEQTCKLNDFVGCGKRTWFHTKHK